MQKKGARLLLGGMGEPFALDENGVLIHLPTRWVTNGAGKDGVFYMSFDSPSKVLANGWNLCHCGIDPTTLILTCNCASYAKFRPQNGGSIFSYNTPTDDLAELILIT